MKLPPALSDDCWVDYLPRYSLWSVHSCWSMQKDEGDEHPSSCPSAGERYGKELCHPKQPRNSLKKRVIYWCFNWLWKTQWQHSLGRIWSTLLSMSNSQRPTNMSALLNTAKVLAWRNHSVSTCMCTFPCSGRQNIHEIIIEKVQLHRNDLRLHVSPSPGSLPSETCTERAPRTFSNSCAPDFSALLAPWPTQR